MNASANPDPEELALDDLDVLLAHGFGKAGAAPQTSGFSLAGTGAGLALTEPAPPSALPPDLASEDAPSGGNLLGRYQVFGEFARGGVGALYRARDLVLRRDVAVKVLLARHKDRPELRRRFVEEAQICAQLQHPCIVPLHDAGLTEDGRPFLAMKLIQGETLAARLCGRSRPSEQRHELLRILSQVCQAIAYAHARGVLHRDLKPGNVMVGAFGEVQVMDFGMAKVLAREETSGRQPAHEDQAQPVTTTRSDEPTSASVSGSVMGTYAYMSPEQARGAVELLDARSDVFGLGAILCEILTGAAPYRGERDELRSMAAEAELSDAHARLDASGAEAELVALCKRCLAPSQADRPKDGGALAQEIDAHLVSVEERARSAELRLARAEEQALAGRKRRRLRTALLLSILVFASTGAWLWAASSRQQALRTSRTAEAVERTIAEARENRPDPGDDSPEATNRWAAALAGARQARELARGPDADEATRARAGLFLAEMESADRKLAARREQATNDARMRSRLSEIHARLMSSWRWEEHDREYAAAFREHGIELGGAAQQASARVIAQSAIAVDLIQGLDQWGQCKTMCGPGSAESRAQVYRLLETVDPDPLRVQIRTALRDKNRDLALKLAQECDLGSLAPASAGQLSWALWATGSGKEAVRLCCEAVTRHPGDFYLNFQAAMLIGFTHAGNPADMVRYYSAALAVRPDSMVAATNLAEPLMKCGRVEEAEILLTRMLSLHPDAPMLLGNLGTVLSERQRFEEALVPYRRVLELEALDPRNHENLARTLKRLGRLDEAQSVYSKALERFPDDDSLWLSYGAMLCDQRNDPSGAAQAFEKVVELKADDKNGWRNLAIARAKLGDAEGMLSALRKLLELDPRSVWALENMANVFFAEERYEEARSSLEAAVELEPRNATLNGKLSAALDYLGRADEALIHARRACELDPGDPRFWLNLGGLLAQKEDWMGAQTAFGKVLELQPDDATARAALEAAQRHGK